MPFLKPMSRRQIIITGTLILIVTGIVTLLILRNGGAEVKKEESNTTVNYVRTAEAAIEDHDIIIKGNGRLLSSRNVVLIAEVPGKLLPGAVVLKSGAGFKSGQLLFAIDDKEMQLKMQSRKSGFLTMLATALPDLKIDFPESFKTWEAFFQQIDVTKNLPELPEIKDVKGKTYLASKNILGEFYSIKADEELLRRYKVYAPFDGNFIDVFTELGTVVNPGSQIARIIQTGNVEVEVPVSVSETQHVNIGDQVNVFVEGESKPVKGKIIRIGQYINPNTQSVDVFIGVEETAGTKLYNGMYVEVEMKAGKLKDVIQVPRRAMIDDRHVYIVKDSLLLSHPVRTILKSETSFYIQGVENGTQIVVEALSNPVDSMMVTPIPQYD